MIMGKIVEWRCKDCKTVVKNPIACIGNHGCMKCSVCRGIEMELVRNDSE